MKLNFHPNENSEGKEEQKNSSQKIIKTFPVPDEH